MKEELGRIDSARLGFEIDREIFTFWLMFDFGGGCQGFGGVTLDSYDEKYERRIPEKEGMRLVTDIMRVFEVKEFHKIKGRICYVLRGTERGSILGIRTLPFETNKIILISDYFKEVD